LEEPQPLRAAKTSAFPSALHAHLCSWLNLVERFFPDLRQDVVLPGSFASVDELVEAIWKY